MKYETTVATCGKYELAVGGSWWMIWESGMPAHTTGGPTRTIKRHVGSEKYIKNLWKKLTKAS